MMMGTFITLDYLRSKQGILKIAQHVILLAAFACVRSTLYNNLHAYRFYEGVTLGYAVAIFIFLFLTVFGIPKRVLFVNWAVAEFVLDTLGFIFVSIGSIVAAVKSCEVEFLVAASVHQYKTTVWKMVHKKKNYSEISHRFQ
ncbi:CKLF-like MARVEL transmembrane domain-containing protein 7 isoform X2 [Myxocyprinus asiaticus]|uniref:CKLF-like MARVEL transmembrane domain-containing protein 7 isoform X2 n=1 Tax=Myxocyprinus asiaticus TaxID=70543 RepID=UPI0022234011|nr:CKLF-like MARVEL transmembrane domain-containing protein 7 isoform X2 [Myxocyprinus asiaticus]